MSDRQFWQLYVWVATTALWLYVLVATALIPMLRARKASHRMSGPHHSTRRNGTEAVTR